MFREMRRKERQMDREEIEKMLKESDYGILSVNGDDGYPYGVPVNYAFSDGKIYFHGTSDRCHKLDAIKCSPKVCFTVVGRHELDIANYSTYYSSVVVFGRARVIEEPAEKGQAMKKMMAVLARAVPNNAAHDCGGDGYVMVEITPEHMTGKARKQ